MQQTGGVFQTGPKSNFLIQGGQFIQNGQVQGIHNCYDVKDGFQHLQAHVAPNAYASQQEGDAPKCHPNTRTAVLNAMIHWVTVATAGLSRILWLNGAAGAGKSAIARSIVDLRLEQRYVIAHFFFFRTDPTRNHVNSVIATLAYELIQSIPDLDSIITPRIRSNPLIFNESLEAQFKVLIFEPLKQLHRESPFDKPIVLLLDGVDECNGDNDQVNLIRTVAQFIAEKVIPLMVIFSSRAESHLQMIFNSPKIDTILRRIPLDNDYRAADDIQLFLDDSFGAIKTTHPFRSMIDPEWPSPTLVQEITDKSSGQFIYASVVINFVSSPRLHPVQQLEIIRGLRPAGELTPFAQLDSLYHHIFSQVHGTSRVTAILAVAILSDYPYRSHICEMLDIAYDDIDVALAELTPVISLNNEGKISFLHASLPAFLLDQSRGKQFYIDKGFWGSRLAVKLLRNKRLLGIGDVQFIGIYLNQARCTSQLREAIYAFLPPEQAVPRELLHDKDVCQIWSSYMNAIKNLDFRDDGEAYRHQLTLVKRHLREFYPQTQPYYELENNQDILGILREIEGENETVGVWLKLQHLFRKVPSQQAVNITSKVSSRVQSKSHSFRAFRKH